MPLKDLIEHLSEESSALVSEFSRAARLGKGTPQEIAEFRENYFRNFIRRYYPSPYKVTKGKIRDSYERVSASIDCVIVHPSHPHLVDSEEKFSLVFADGVDAAIELKPDISDSAELERGLKQICSVKKLRRVKGPIIFPDRKPPEVLEHSKTVPTFIFSSKAKAKPLDTAEEVSRFYYDSATPLVEQVDAIIINDVGIINNYKYVKTQSEQCNENDFGGGLVFEQWGNLTLPRFLLYLTEVYGAEPSNVAPFLAHYLEGLTPNSFEVVVNYNRSDPYVR